MNPADLKIHQNQDQNENHSAAVIHKEGHFGLKKHEGKRKFRLLSMSCWPDSLQLGEPTRCSLLNLLPFSCCCCLLCVVNKYCCAIWIRYSQTFHMLYFSNTWCWEFLVTLRATEWITSSVGSFMCLQMAWRWAFVATKGAAEWFSTTVYSFVCLQLTWCWAFVATLGAAEWFITSVGSFMNLQMMW